MSFQSGLQKFRLEQVLDRDHVLDDPQAKEKSQENPVPWHELQQASSERIS